MEKIIGREAEFSKLTDYMDSGKSEFIALYGRFLFLIPLSVWYSQGDR